MKSKIISIISIISIIAILFIALAIIACGKETSFYTVIYDANGGIGEMPNSTFTIGEPQNLRHNTFTNKNLEYFAGWARTSAGSVEFTDGQSVTNLSNTANDVVTLYAVWKKNAYTIIYNANGGNGTMANSVFTMGLSQNLTVNTFTHPNPDYCFEGWARTATGGVEFNDGQSVWNIFAANDVVILYAVWYSTNVSGPSLAAKLEWLQTNAVSDRTYTIEVTADEVITPTSLYFSGKNNIQINLKGIGSVRTIMLASNGSMFTVGYNVTLSIDNNISLMGLYNNDRPLLSLSSLKSTFIMNGGEITGNSSSMSLGGGVYIGGGTFILNGGKISGNSSSGGGGVGIYGGGTFIMNDGEITGNASTGNFSGGGGVCCTDGTFIMNDGKISNNSANYHGGGVRVTGFSGVTEFGTFTMNGGEISNNRTYFLNT